MLCFVDNHYLVHIQVYIQCMDLPGIQLSMCIRRYYTEHLDHKEMDYMDLSRLELELLIKIIYKNNDLDIIYKYYQLPGFMSHFVNGFPS